MLTLSGMEPQPPPVGYDTPNPKPRLASGVDWIGNEEMIPRDCAEDGTIFHYSSSRWGKPHFDRRRTVWAATVDCAISIALCSYSGSLMINPRFEAS